MIELKPCPFCGKTDTVGMICKRAKSGGITGPWRDTFFVLCDYNDGGCGGSGGWYHYEEEAAEAWNKRTR